MHFVTGSFLKLVEMPGATSSFFFTQDYWQFALHERRLLSTPPLTPTRESMAVALGLAALAAVVAGVVVAEERDERARRGMSDPKKRMGLFNVLSTVFFTWEEEVLK